VPTKRYTRPDTDTYKLRTYQARAKKTRKTTSNKDHKEIGLKSVGNLRQTLLFGDQSNSGRGYRAERSGHLSCMNYCGFWWNYYFALFFSFPHCSFSCGLCVSLSATTNTLLSLSLSNPIFLPSRFSPLLLHRCPKAAVRQYRHLLRRVALGLSVGPLHCVVPATCVCRCTEARFTSL
jgi:hypothetical protein